MESCDIDVTVEPLPCQPTWLQELKNVTTMEGENVVMSCQARGYPAPTFTFYEDGNLLQESNKLHISTGDIYCFYILSTYPYLS